MYPLRQTVGPQSRFVSVLCAAALIHQSFAAKLSLLGTKETRIEDEYLIGFEKGEEGTRLLHEAVANWPEQFEHKPSVLMARPKANILHAKMTDEGVAHAESLPGVSYIHHNLIVRKMQSAGSQQNPRPGLDRIDQTSGLDGVYNFRSDGAGVDIYILDTGVDVNHPDWNNNQAQHVADCAGATNVNTCRSADPGDPDGHGTHVAGIAASPTYGVAKEANVFTVRVLGADGSGSLAGIISGMQVAEAFRTQRGNPPSVINMSLGGGRSNAFNDAVDGIADSFPTVVAAGNEAQDANNVSPASARNVITVGSSTRNDVVSSFSNSGPRVDIFAVGSQVRSLNANTDGSTVISGTSMASPTVAGAVAQLLSVNGARTPEQLRAILIGTASTGQLSGNAIQGTPNRLLNVAGDAFAVEEEPVPETDPPPTTGQPQPQPTPTSDVCASTVDGDFTFQNGFLTRGIMLDVQDLESDGTGAELESITVFTTTQVTNGQAAFFFVEDGSSFQIQNIERDRSRWSLVLDQSGDFRVVVNSESQPERIGQFDLFRTSIALPSVHSFQPGTRQGIYVTFIDNNLFAADFRGANLDVDTALVDMPPISILPGRAVRRRLFGGNAVDPSFPVLELCYSNVGQAGVLRTEAPAAEEPIVRLNDQLDCLVSTNNNESTWSVQSGVMFDLTVNSIETADLPGVWLESFSVWLQDTMEAGIAEVYTTVNGGSFQGQETNRDAWVMIAQRMDLNQQTFPADFEDEDTVIWLDDMSDSSMQDDTEIIDDLERSGEPVLFDFDFEMHYELRRDDTPQGFYVTFREDQMRYYNVAGTDENDLITSNDFVTMTGGVGVAYPFAETFTPRQFSGEACFSYEEVSAAPSVAIARASVTAAVLAAFVLATLN